MLEKPSFYLIRIPLKRRGTRKNCNNIFMHITRSIRNKRPLYIVLPNKTIFITKIYSVEKEIGKDYDRIEIVGWSKKIILEFWHSQPDKPLNVYVYDLALEPTISYD